MLKLDLLPAAPQRSAGTLLLGAGPVFGDLDFSSLKETKPDALFEAWLALPEEHHKPMDAESQDIFELNYLCAYPEGYSQQSIEWVNGECARRPHNPAFEVFFVYSQKQGRLDLNFRGLRKAVEPL